MRNWATEVTKTSNEFLANLSEENRIYFSRYGMDLLLKKLEVERVLALRKLKEKEATEKATRQKRQRAKRTIEESQQQTLNETLEDMQKQIDFLKDYVKALEGSFGYLQHIVEHVKEIVYANPHTEEKDKTHKVV